MGIRVVVAGWGVAWAIFAFSCAMPPGEKAMTEEEFVQLYVDLATVQQELSGCKAALLAEQEKILRAHGRTREEFDRFVSDCGDDPETWASIYRRIVEESERREQSGSGPPTPHDPPGSTEVHERF